MAPPAVTRTRDLQAADEGTATPIMTTTNRSQALNMVPFGSIASQRDLHIFEEAFSFVSGHANASGVSTGAPSLLSAALERVQQQQQQQQQQRTSSPQRNASRTMRFRLSSGRQAALSSTGNGAYQPLNQQPPVRRSQSSSTPSVHPQFRAKSVCLLYCKQCSTELCRRGMKAILLGNTKVELFSTDTPPIGVQLVYQDYMTQNCSCRIRDAACLGCGNVVGYHVTQPCETCLDACNNGHFWMFHAEGVGSVDRMDRTGKQVLRWASLPCAEEDNGDMYELKTCCDYVCR